MFDEADGLLGLARRPVTLSDALQTSLFRPCPIDFLIHLCILQLVEMNNRTIIGPTPMRSSENYIVYYNFWYAIQVQRQLQFSIFKLFEDNPA